MAICADSHSFIMVTMDNNSGVWRQYKYGWISENLANFIPKKDAL